MSLRLNRVVIHLLAVAQLAFAQTAGSADAQAAGVVAAGTPAPTPYFVCDSGVPGPTVVIIAGLHGDEPAGPLAVDQICNWPVTRGKVVVLPRANAVALKAGKRLTPGAGPDEGNLNRNFPTDTSEAARGELASNLWAFVARQRPTWFVDLHEGIDFSGQTNRSVGSSLIVCPVPEGRSLGMEMQKAVNASITNETRHFTLRSPPVDGSLARAAGAHLGAQAMILETTTKGQPLSVRVRQHRILVHALLSGLDMLDVRVTPERMAPRGAAAGAAVRVAVYDDGGTGGVGGRRVEEQVRQQLGAFACRVCGDDIRGGALDGFDVVVFPGGSGSREAASLGEGGRARIRAFVENGGGYIGICAGAYLALCDFSWGLRILDAKTVSPLWRRGVAEVELELTDEGRRILGGRDGTFDCHYANGPCMTPANVEELPDYETLAWFRSEVAEHGAPPGVMSNSPAIVAGRYGKGRVLCSSPHPEQTVGLGAFVPRAVAWVTGR